MSPTKDIVFKGGALQYHGVGSNFVAEEDPTNGPTQHPGGYLRRVLDVDSSEYLKSWWE